MEGGFGLSGNEHDCKDCDLSVGLSIVIKDSFCVKNNYKRLAETFLYIFMPALTDLEYALCDCILLRGRDTLCVCVC